ncbi:hypothetical protein ROLI_029350 [Roseobacter fucihabitans]|uniref:Uncharacterized protein n=1 Tax=Roseobacter fucihabitans TaxID=1537242 RepID=A0ABZ2BXE7_9RHOB|nr:hypothetical protein [Roseobacter litoralis]MBC6964853.1 hypothetical protein [Roseobacter litoralis]
MLNNLHSLDLTADDIEMIESALHTQKKILAVQSEAGGSGAQKRLTDLQHLMKRINRNAKRKPAAQMQSWSHFFRMFFCTECKQTR